MGRMLQDVVRIDVDWDVYREDRLKAQTGQNCGAGNQLRVANNTYILVNWKNFIRFDANKDGLFRFLANIIPDPPHGKQIISTHGQNAVSSPMSDLSDLYCTHEQAHTQLLFHASRALIMDFPR